MVEGSAALGSVLVQAGGIYLQTPSLTYIYSLLKGVDTAA